MCRTQPTKTLERGILLAAAAFALLTAGSAAADEIRDTSCAASGGGKLVARYTSEGEARYIGASVRLKDGQEVDLDAKEIETGAGLAKWQPGLREHMTEYSVSLWRTKVDKGSCTIKSCAYCKRNGYHLEGRVAGTEWAPCGSEPAR